MEKSDYWQFHLANVGLMQAESRPCIIQSVLYIIWLGGMKKGFYWPVNVANIGLTKAESRPRIILAGAIWFG